MKYPIFAHGSMASIKKAISDGKIKYPAYCWVDDTDQYAFLNKDGEFEVCGIAKKYGDLSNLLILSDLTDGIYQISGSYKITDTSETIYQDVGALAIIQTDDETKKIRMISSDDISTYTIDGETVIENVSATKDYVDVEISTLESKILDMIDEAIQGESNENIIELFN